MTDLEINTETMTATLLAEMELSSECLAEYLEIIADIGTVTRSTYDATSKRHRLSVRIPLGYNDALAKQRAAAEADLKHAIWWKKVKGSLGLADGGGA